MVLKLNMNIRGMMNEFMNDSTELMNMNVRGITNVKGMKDEYMNEWFWLNMNI